MKSKSKTAATEALELRYIPLSQAKRWDQNPKRHDIPALIKSIEIHGFGDPPKFDAKLGGLVYGNGRTEALEKMREAGQSPPRGIAQLEGGEWAVPVIFGVDAPSKAAAVAFAVDHNNLTLMGGDLDFAAMMGVWDHGALRALLTPDVASLLASMPTVADVVQMMEPTPRETALEDSTPPKVLGDDGAIDKNDRSGASPWDRIDPSKSIKILIGDWETSLSVDVVARLKTRADATGLPLRNALRKLLTEALEQ